MAVYSESLSNLNTVSLHISTTDYTNVKRFFLFLTSVLPLCVSPVLSLTFEHLSSIFFQFLNCVPYLCIPTATQFAKEMGFRVESPPSLFSSLHCPLSISPSSPSLSLSFLSSISLYPRTPLPLSKIPPFHPFFSTPLFLPLSLYFCLPCFLFPSLSCVHLFFICCTDYRSL